MKTAHSVATAALLVLLVGCGGAAEEVGTSDDSAESIERVDSSDALDQMVVAFEGSWSRPEIENRLAKAMQLYDLPVTEENRSRAGSALVVMRRENGVTEMEILEHMICSHVDGVDVSFSDMTAISAIAVANGDSC